MSVKFAAGGQDVVKSLRTANPTNWVVVGYNAGNEIEVVGSGSGGLEELRGHLHEDKIQYALLRVQDSVDGHATTKFVFIVWLGDQVKTITKARVTTHRGDVKDWFGQSHVTIDAANLAELTEEIVMGKVSEASGTSTRALGDHTATAGGSAAAPTPGAHTQPAPSAAAPAASRPPPKQVSNAGASLTTQPKKGNAVNTTSVALDFQDADHMKAQITTLRKDDGGIDWVLFGYEGDKTIKLIGSGNGGPDEMARHIDSPDEGAYYGYVRFPTVVDGTNTVKFLLVLYQGDKIKVVRKAKIATHVGAISDFVGQFHLKLEYAKLEDVSKQNIGEAVDRATFSQKAK